MYYSWKPYVRVADRRAQAARYAAKLAKAGRVLVPVRVTGRAVATTFWGKAWCANLESYSDYANRLPRGRTYLRNGSVVDLQIDRGTVKAIVSGSDIYQVEIKIHELAGPLWKRIKKDCSESIPSLLDLLQGRFSQAIMERLTRPRDGFFPHPKEISMRCSCPDWAVLCKHVAAVLYGIGSRLDREPELLFRLRAVDHRELVQQALSQDNLDQALDSGPEGALSGEDLGDLFGIELDGDANERPASGRSAASKKESRGRTGQQPKEKPAPKTVRAAKAVKRAAAKTSSAAARAAKTARRATPKTAALASRKTRKTSSK